MDADSTSGKSRVEVWEYRVPVTAEFMASAQQKTLLYRAGGLEQGISVSLAALVSHAANPACKLRLCWTRHPVIPNPTLGAPSSLQPQKG